MGTAGGAPRESTHRIVIADPDADTRKLYRACLQQTGCDVIDAQEGRDALVSALMSRPTLVITETRLPMLNGYQLCEELRRDPQTHALPILVVTGESRPSELIRAHDAGASAVLAKPITPEALLIEVQRLIAQSDTNGTPSAAPPPATAGERRRRQTLVRAHQRLATTTPPACPPDLMCPSCICLLNYERSHVGGVNRAHAEQWDTYACASCGTFEYRHRTRRLRKLA